MKDNNKLNKFDKNKGDIIANLLIALIIMLPGIITFIITKSISCGILGIIIFWLFAIIMVN